MNKTTKYIISCLFDNTDYLPGDNNNNNDDDDKGDISTYDMEAADDEVAEIFRKQVTL